MSRRPWSTLEERFVDLAFGLGDIEGMTPEDIHAYVRYVADWRLTQLKLPTVFGYFEATEGGYRQLKPHPLPWLVEILNGVEHANFFEQRATEYSKGASRGTLGRRRRRLGGVRACRVAPALSVTTSPPLVPAKAGTQSKKKDAGFPLSRE